MIVWLDYLTLAIFVAAGIILLAILGDMAREAVMRWQSKRRGAQKMAQLMRKWRDAE